MQSLHTACAVENEAVSAALEWLVDQEVSHGLAVWDSQSMIKKIEKTFSSERTSQLAGTITREGIKVEMKLADRLARW